MMTDINLDKLNLKENIIKKRIMLWILVVVVLMVGEALFVHAKDSNYIDTYNTERKTITQIATPEAPILVNKATGVKISWKKVKGGQLYRIFRKTGSGKWKKIKDTDATSFIDKAVVSGKTYTYTIRCINNEGTTYISAYNKIGKTITYVAAPEAPILVNKATGVKISWKKVKGGKLYRVFRKTGSGKWKKIKDTDATSFIDKTVVNGKTYTYTIRCLNKNGTAYTSSYNQSGKSIRFYSKLSTTDASGYNYAGKTAAFFGDSLTEVNYQYSKGYHQWIKELLGLRRYENYGVSGSTLSDICKSIRNNPTNADIIFVMGGVNNQTFHVPLGTVNDTTLTTTYGALYQICKTLKTNYSDRKIIFITPTYQTAYPHKDGITHTQIGNAMKTLCKRFGFLVYDNGSLSGINRNTLVVMTNDNCHWNDATHRSVGQKISKWLINNN